MLALEETTAVRRPSARTARTKATDPSKTRTAPGLRWTWTRSFLRLLRPSTVDVPGASDASPSGRSMPRDAQERPGPLQAGTAVDVALVVVLRERHERLAVPLRPRRQELVEHLLPGARVHAGRVGQDAVEVEQAGDHALR